MVVTEYFLEYQTKKQKSRHVTVKRENILIYFNRQDFI